MEGTNDNFSNEFNKEFMYLYEICTITKQKIYIGKYILNHSELFRASKKCRLIIVDALFHSASINLCKITDVTEEINVISFGKKYRKKSSKQDKDDWKRLQPQKKDLEQLQARRNKSLAHSDRENIEKDIEAEYPLYVETLERVVTATEMALDYIYRCNKSKPLIGVDQKTGEAITMFDKMIKMECNAAKKYSQTMEAIQKHMKENHALELATIIYSLEGEEVNGQAENAHAE